MLAKSTLHLFSWHKSLRLGLDALCVVENLLGVIFCLQLLQPWEMLSIVLVLSNIPRQPGIGIVGIRTPLALRKRLGGGIDPAVEEAEGTRRVSLIVLVAVVELDEVELVAVRVRGVVDADLGHLRILSAVHVELEEPEAVDDFVGDVKVVVHEVLGRSPIETLESQALGIKVFPLSRVRIRSEM